jgi:hypothetical protein
MPVADARKKIWLVDTKSVCLWHHDVELLLTARGLCLGA